MWAGRRTASVLTVQRRAESGGIVVEELVVRAFSPRRVTEKGPVRVLAGPPGSRSTNQVAQDPLDHRGLVSHVPDSPDHPHRPLISLVHLDPEVASEGVVPERVFSVSERAGEPARHQPSRSSAASVGGGSERNNVR